MLFARTVFLAEILGRDSRQNLGFTFGSSSTDTLLVFRSAPRVWSATLYGVCRPKVPIGLCQWKVLCGAVWYQHAGCPSASINGFLRRQTRSRMSGGSTLAASSDMFKCVRQRYVFESFVHPRMTWILVNKES